MKINLKRLCCVIAAVILIAGLVAGSVSQSYAQANPGVIPPNAHAYGMTYGELSAAWWQWAFSLPVNQNPFFDENGSCVNGANGQFEFAPVWFLTGVINVSGTAVRNCTIPAGTPLFFPIINTECSTLEAPPFYGGNEAELLACARAFQFKDVFATIDGVAVQNLDRYLVESPLFTFTVPPGNVLGVAPASGQSVTRGYYLMLAPLSVGLHTIHFSGTLLFPDATPPFTVDITYNLTVAPRRP